jgi:hypothetical protein
MKRGAHKHQQHQAPNTKRANRGPPALSSAITTSSGPPRSPEGAPVCTPRQRLHGCRGKTQLFCMHAAGFCNFSRSQITHLFANRSSCFFEGSSVYASGFRKSLMHCLSCGVIFQPPTQNDPEPHQTQRVPQHTPLFRLLRISFGLEAQDSGEHCEVAGATAQH